MIKVHVRNIPGTVDDEVFIFDMPESKGGMTRNLVVEKGEIVWKEFAYNHGAVDQVKYLFRIDSRDTRALIQAFISVGDELGIEKPSEAHNAGELEATKIHLKDMRVLVFDKKEEISGGKVDIKNIPLSPLSDPVCLKPKGNCTFEDDNHYNHPKG